MIIASAGFVLSTPALAGYFRPKSQHTASTCSPTVPVVARLHPAGTLVVSFISAGHWSFEVYVHGYAMTSAEARQRSTISFIFICLHQDAGGAR